MVSGPPGAGAGPATCRVGLAHPSGTSFCPTHEGPPHQPSHASQLPNTSVSSQSSCERQTTFQEATLDRQPCFSFQGQFPVPKTPA